MGSEGTQEGLATRGLASGVAGERQSGGGGRRKFRRGRRGTLFTSWIQMPGSDSCGGSAGGSLAAERVSG